MKMRILLNSHVEGGRKTPQHTVCRDNARWERWGGSLNWMVDHHSSETKIHMPVKPEFRLRKSERVNLRLLEIFLGNNEKLRTVFGKIGVYFHSPLVSAKIWNSTILRIALGNKTLKWEDPWERDSCCSTLTNVAGSEQIMQKFFQQLQGLQWWRMSTTPASGIFVGSTGPRLMRSVRC